MLNHLRLRSLSSGGLMGCVASQVDAEEDGPDAPHASSDGRPAVVGLAAQNKHGALQQPQTAELDRVRGREEGDGAGYASVTASQARCLADSRCMCAKHRVAFLLPLHSRRLTPTASAISRHLGRAPVPRGAPRPRRLPRVPSCGAAFPPCG